MDCSRLSDFLEGQLPADALAQFEHHLVTCRNCQDAMEAEMQLSALGDELARHPDRPRAVPFLDDAATRSDARRRRKLPWISAGVLAAAAVLILLWIPGPTPPPEAEVAIASSLLPNRPGMERLPYAALDGYRDYDTTRAGPQVGRGDPIPLSALAALDRRPDRSQLIAVLIGQGNLVEADRQLQQAGSGDNLDVERAIVAERKGQSAVALGLLDQVIARSPRHAQALWNRAVVLTDLELPLAAAEAFDACAKLDESGWSREAAHRRDELRREEAERKERSHAVIAACNQLGDGVVPELDVVRKNVGICRPSFYIAVRRATTRDEVQKLAPVARAIDEASGDTASSALVGRITAADFKARAPSIALYTRLVTTPGLAAAEQARIVAQLRASGQSDLLLGALLRVATAQPSYVDELVRLARATQDPYFEEYAIRAEAEARAASGKALEAELALREAVKQCAARNVELRCAYLQLGLVGLYLARHRPTEAIDTTLVALRRSRQLGTYWDERLLFGFLAQAAELSRDYAQMRAYLREAALREPECFQTRLDQETIAGVELAELRFPSALAEIDRAPTCDQPLSLVRAQVEAELAEVAPSPARLSRMRGELDRIRHIPELTRSEHARVDAIEGRLLAATDPAAARTALQRAIAAADALSYDDVVATKARNLAYRTLLMLGAKDLDAPALLALFAAAGRAPPRAGCTLGALVDGGRLLLVARDATGKFQQVFDPHAFKAPDLDARTIVPPALVTALSSCPRVDVLALAPLYGQPQLLPPQLAWSYRGPAGTPPAAARRPTVLTVEDARPPAALALPRLASPSHAPRDTAVDDVVVRGTAATPDRVRKELAQADFAEFHAHGFVDLGISDVSLIALSPDADGNFALTARVISGMKLARAPFITLAACDAAYTAPYLHEPWSLPYAFLLAGARGVLAPATAIPDKDADRFFRSVGDQLLRGVDPAVVLRDQRMQRHAGPTDWVSGVVVFD